MNLTRSKQVPCFYFLFYLCYSIQFSESFIIPHPYIFRNPGTVLENVISNSTTQLSTATLQAPAVSGQIFQNEQTTNISNALAFTTRQQRQVPDQARFLLNRLRRQNCFSKVLCNVGASPLISKNDNNEDILDNYVSLMEELLTDDVKQGYEIEFPSKPKTTTNPTQKTKPSANAIIRDQDESSEDEEDNKTFPQLELDDGDTFEPDLDHLSDFELRPPVYHPLPQYYPTSGPPYARYRRSSYSLEQKNLDKFLQQRMLELDNEKDFKKQLSLAADTGRTLGFSNQRQCWRLFHDCPLTNRQIDSLAKGLRQIINARGNISSLTPTTTASPTAVHSQATNAAKPGNKVEIILNLGSNGIPYGAETINSKSVYQSMVHAAQNPAPTVSQINPYGLSLTSTTTAKPEEDEEKLMDFLYGVLNHNDTKDSVTENVTEPDFVETPLKVRNTQKTKLPDPFGLGVDTLFDEDDDADPPEEAELSELKEYLGSYKKVLSKFYQMNNVDKVASVVLKEEIKKKKNENQQAIDREQNRNKELNTTTTTENSEEEDDVDAASEESNESAENDELMQYDLYDI